MSHYFMILRPPRPTFPGDMTAEERQLMQQHAQYWRALLEERVSVVFGPVMDPQGAFGVGIFRAEDEAAARSLVLADPVIQANAGFRFELHPMGNAIYRE
jgi:uncharacterized protein